MRIHHTARQHGIRDEDMLHAARHAMTDVPGPTTLLMLIGPARTGRLLEVGVVDPDDDPVIIHAMVLRPAFQRFLRRR